MDSIDWVGIAEKVGIAIAIIVVTWIIAMIVKWAISKLVMKIPMLKRQGPEGEATGNSIGQIGSLLVWLFGLVAVLQVFSLDAVLAPIQGLLNTIMDYLPNLIGAAVVFFLGFVIAKIVKQLIEAAVGVLKFDGLKTKMQKVDPTADSTAEVDGPKHEKPESQFDGQKIGSLVGNLAFAVIVILVAIAALQILGISAISDPAEQMLTVILNTLPAILAAAIILGIGGMISKFAGDLLESTLRGLNTDKAVSSLGVVSEEKSASKILTRIAQVAIMVFFAIMAARSLDFPEVTNILNEVLALGGRVVFGGLIIGAGFIIAKIISNAIGEGTGSTVVRYATIVLFVAMGLQYMGIADSIITLAFGAVVVGGALAASLAFGLGGRDAASRTLAKMEAKADTKSNTPESPLE